MKIRIFAILLLPTILLANVVWPALYLETRLFSWWPITFGLIIEFFLIKKLFYLSSKHALKAVVVANIISAILGIVLIPLGGILWEIFPAEIYKSIFGWGTFNPITWGGTFLLASLINAIVEGLVYKKKFEIQFSFKSKKFLFLYIINMLSVSIAFISLWIYPANL